MPIPLEHVRNIHAITEAMIATMEEEIARRGVTEGNVPIDAAICCLCYAMAHAGDLDDAELLRRVARYRKTQAVDGAPGGKLA